MRLQVGIAARHYIVSFLVVLLSRLLQKHFEVESRGRLVKWRRDLFLEPGLVHVDP